MEEEPITLETLTEDCKILQYVDEEAFEAAGHAFRLPELEELDTYVFQNEDGTRSIYYLYENVKYIDEQGNIREKDNTLKRETKGFRITENEFDLLLPHAVTDGVELTYQGYDVKLIPATEGKLTATAPGTLRENSVVYESFFGAGTSLVYTPLLSGVKEEIILEEYLPNKSFSFLLYTDGLFLNNTDGSYILTESKASAEAVLYLGDIVVYDAIGRPSLGNLTVETVKDGNIYALTVSADEAFLSDPATVYPVTIDPDITISDTDNGSGAIEDTTLFSGTPNLNTGDWVYNTAGYVDETYGAGRILVRLPGLYNDEVYQGLTADRILSATFYTTKSSSKTPDYVNLYRCTDTAWSENSVTWNYHANLYTNSTNWGTSSVSSSAVTFNITSLVKAWRSGTYSAQAGFMLINQNETDVTKKFGIYSSEHSNTEKRPYFVLNYEADIVLDKAELEVKLGTFGTLNATTSPANQQVSWRSGNEAVASVTPSGVVVPHHAGTTTITAWFTDSDGVDHEAQCTVYVALEDGIYCFDNEYASYRVGLVSPAAYQAGAALYETPGISSLPTERHQFFKVTYLGAGLYSIRSMLDVTLGWEHGGYNPACEEIGTSKTMVPLDAQWYISYDSGGDCYSIYGNTGLGVGDMSRTLTCTGNVELIPHPRLQGYSSSNAMQDWQITKLTYSGSGIELRRKTSYLAVGDSFTFTATVYSSHPDEFGQGVITWSVVNGSVHASISVDGVLEVISVGTASVKAAYVCSTGAPVSTGKTVYIIPFPDGIYFLNNREKGGYIQPDNNAANYSVSGTHLEHHEFDGEDYQKWRLVSLNNGYYKILSVESGLALSVESGDEASMDVDLVQEPYVGAARQQWQFIATSANAYKIKAKSADGSNPELVICANAGTDSGTNIQQDDYEINTRYKDEWLLISAKDMSLIALPEDYDRSSYFESILSSFAAVGYTDSYDNHSIISSGVTQGELLARMANSRIVLIRTHGSKKSITTSDGSLTRGEILDLSENAFEYTELIIYGACSTGLGKEGADNLVNATYDRGASIVVGFEKSVWSTEVNWWCEEFLKALATGKTVYEASEVADDYISYKWPKFYDTNQNPISTDSHYIVGDINTVYTQ